MRYLCVLWLLGVSVGFCQETIKIGDTEWTSTNCSVKTFRNGDPIEELKTAEEWNKAAKSGTPGFCYHNNDPSTAETMGLIYNAYAAIDKRNLAPVGYRVPAKEDFEKLINEYTAKYGTADFGKHIKSETGWRLYYSDVGGNGDNLSGLNLYPFHNPIASYYPDKPGISGGWFTCSSEKDNIWCFRLVADYDYIQFALFDKNEYERNDGLAVRLIKNSPAENEAEKISKTVKLNDKIWMAENLNTKIYSNGDPIPVAKNAREWKKYAYDGVGAYCHLDYDPAKEIVYNWFAVSDPRGLAPIGWKIPDVNDVEESKKSGKFKTLELNYGTCMNSGKFNLSEETTNIFYWCLNPSEPFKMYTYSEVFSGSSYCNDAKSKCKESYGHFVRCIKK